MHRFDAVQANDREDGWAVVGIRTRFNWFPPLAKIIPEIVKICVVAENLTRIRAEAGALAAQSEYESQRLAND